MIYSARPKPYLLTDKPSSLRIHPNLHADDVVTPAPERHPDPIDMELAKRILSRIESRLPGRIRHLTVYATDNAVVLTGQCSTFYTKQIAQHTAMGVLEYQRLINNIEVRVAK